MAKKDDLLAKMRKSIYETMEEIKSLEKSLNLDGDTDSEHYIPKDIICIHCKTRFSSLDPYPALVPCKCQKIYVDASPYSLRLIGELEDVIFIDRDERKTENDF